VKMFVILYVRSVFAATSAIWTRFAGVAVTEQHSEHKHPPQAYATTDEPGFTAVRNLRLAASAYEAALSIRT